MAFFELGSADLRSTEGIKNIQAMEMGRGHPYFRNTLFILFDKTWNTCKRNESFKLSY